MAETLTEYILKKLVISGFALEDNDGAVTAWPRGTSPDGMSITISELPELTPDWLTTRKVKREDMRETELARATARRFITGNGQFGKKNQREFFARNLNKWVLEHAAMNGR
ncbi:MAG: hypothetical protein ABIH46_01405 [Chloroflexota bacterium]